MNCSMCGAIIPTGQTTCPMCGAPVQAAQQPVNPQSVNPQPVNPQPVNPQPVNPQPMNPQMGYGQPMGGQPVNPQPMNPQMGYGQPMGGQPVNPQPMNPQMGYGQPMGGQPVNPQAGGYYQPKSTGAQIYGAGMNGFVNSLKSDLMNIVKLVAAVLLFIAVFLPWGKLEYYDYYGVTSYSHFNLFQTGGVNIFIAILLLLLSLVLIVWEIADFIAPLAKIKASVSRIPYIDLMMLGVMLILIIIGTVQVSHLHRNGVTSVYDDMKRSAGVVFSFIAIIAAIAPRVLDIMGIRIGKK